MTPRWDWPGVVVIGAGVTGLLLAERLRESRIPVLMIEESALAAGQTAHCHGYLHRGYIYQSLSPAQHATLAAGARWWQSQLKTHGVPPLSDASVIAFHDADEHEQTVRNWCDLGMRHEPLDTSGWLPRALAAYRVPEATVAPVATLRTLSPERGLVLPGRATRLHEHAGRLDAVDVLTADGPVTVAAPYFALTAGFSLTPLLAPLRRATRLRRRLSFMLVCQTDQPLPAAFCLPTEEAQGLFVASRPTPHGRCYLISSFISFWLGKDPVMARAMWLAGIARVLAEQLPTLWHDRAARWGLYSAPKTELASAQGHGLPEGEVLDLGWPNTVPVIPGKFVLAPLYAQQAADRLLAAGADRVVGPTPDGDFPSPGWAAEDWRLVPRLTRGELFGGVWWAGGGEPR